MPEFCLPDLGEGLTEAEITAWRVQVGDEVSTDQIVVEVETAKAAVEVPVPFAGRVTALHAREGQVVPVGAPLISVTPAGANGTLAVAAPAAAPVTAAAPERSGSVLVGYGTTAGSGRRRRHVRPPRPAPPPAGPPERAVLPV